MASYNEKSEPVAAATTAAAKTATSVGLNRRVTINADGTETIVVLDENEPGQFRIKSKLKSVNVFGFSDPDISDQPLMLSSVGD